MVQGQRLTSNDLARQFSDATGLSNEEAKRYWRIAMNIINRGIADENVVVLDMVGTLTPYQSKPRSYRVRGELKHVGARQRVRFRLSSVLRDQMNK